MANRKEHRQSSEPIKTQSKDMTPTRNKDRKRVYERVITGHFLVPICRCVKPSCHSYENVFCLLVGFHVNQIHFHISGFDETRFEKDVNRKQPIESASTSDWLKTDKLTFKPIAFKPSFWKLQGVCTCR